MSCHTGKKRIRYLGASRSLRLDQDPGFALWRVPRRIFSPLLILLMALHTDLWPLKQLSQSLALLTNFIRSSCDFFFKSWQRQQFVVPVAWWTVPTQNSSSDTRHWMDLYVKLPARPICSRFTKGSWNVESWLAPLGLTPPSYSYPYSFPW